MNTDNFKLEGNKMTAEGRVTFQPIQLDEFHRKLNQVSENFKIVGVEGRSVGEMVLDVIDYNRKPEQTRQSVGAKVKVTIEVLEVTDMPLPKTCPTCKSRILNGALSTAQGNVALYLCAKDAKICRMATDQASCNQYEIDSIIKEGD